MAAAAGVMKVIDGGVTVPASTPRRVVNGSHATVHIERGTGHCSKHGEYTYEARRSGSSIVGQRCPQCLFLGQAVAAQRNADLQAREHQRWRNERLRLAQLPEAFRGATFDNYFSPCPEAAQVQNNLRVYVSRFAQLLVQRPVNGVVLTGVPGTGKTHLACAMANALIDATYSVRYATIPGLLLSLQDARTGRGERSADAILRELTEPDFAILDEYGPNTQRDVDYQSLFALIDSRYARNRPTLLISNLQYEVLTESVGERMLERVQGPFGLRQGFSWASYREARS